jgi:hypothetical protein
MSARSADVDDRGRARCDDAAVSRVLVARSVAALLVGSACGDADERDTAGPGSGILTSLTGSTDPGETSGVTGTTTENPTGGTYDPTGPGPTSDPPMDTGDESGDDTDDPQPIDCLRDPDQPACDCEVKVGDEYMLGPCAPACQDETWRYVLWVTNYNVAGTLGYGEHQGLAILGKHYRYDRRYAPESGIAAPWLWTLGAAVSAADQFRARTSAPGGELYEPAVEMPGDADDLFSGETLPLTPVLAPHPVIDAAALCEPPATVLDRRMYNHGRTLAETVPNHAWDSFFGKRDLIPLQALAAIEVTRRRDGTTEGTGTASEVEQCLATIRDGFCESQCGNCSYVLSTGFGLPLSSTPDNQITNIPQGTQGPYQEGPYGAPVNARDNFSRLEDDRIVWYVGGSSFGRAEDVAQFVPAMWPDPDLVTVDDGSFVSVVGPLAQGQQVPDEYDDPFTHCVDPNALVASQSPILTTSFLSGRWGHNSNSDAQADLVQFLDCGDAPVASADPLWWNDNACLACGEPRLGPDDAPTQAPCQDLTHTAVSYWDAAPGAHDIDDLDPGRYTAVGPERVPAKFMSQVPDPVCAFALEPVLGM